MTLTLTAQEHLDQVIDRALGAWDEGDPHLAINEFLDVMEHPGTAHIPRTPVFMEMLSFIRDFGTRESFEGFMRDFNVA